MAIKQLNPYLVFGGTGREAIAHYEKALGAKAEVMPNPEDASRVMHARLQIGAGVVMLSDDRPGSTPKQGDSTHVMLDFDDEADLRARFEALSVGGKVVMAPEATFWGAIYGQLVDKFGIHWMFNCQKAGA